MALAGAGFDLAVRELSTLRPHEQTIARHVEEMVGRLSRDGVQKDPIIVDGRSGVVLDGMHRLAAFRRLGFDQAVVCAVDYGSAKVTVERWARVYRAASLGNLRKAVIDAGFRRELPAGDAIRALAEREVGVAATFGKVALVPEADHDLGRAFELVEEVDRIHSELGWERSFVPEEGIEAEVSKGGRVALLVETLRKDDVMEAAMGGRLFPCKTSMHTIDPRPVALGFPLDVLKDGTQEDLRKFLSGREPSLLPPGSKYEGRRYKERLVMLNPG